MRQASLMYHDVVADGCWDESGFPGAAAARYKLENGEFARHLDALMESGLDFGAVDARAPGSQCLLTFDDGGASAVHVGTALAARNMRGHFFITTSRIGTPGFVSAQDLRGLRRDGHVIGSHSHTHPAEISRLTARQLREEWQLSVEHLGDLLGEPIEVASIPGGFYSDAVAWAAESAGIRFLFTSEPITHVGAVGACRVMGRYALWRGMDARHALALARGEGGVRARQWLTWNLKKPAKRWAGPAYRFARTHLLGESSV